MSKAVPIPPSFMGRMSRLLGEEYPSFAKAMARPAAHGLRVNTLKLTPEQFEKMTPFPLEGRVPWCPSAFHLKGEEKPGKHPYHYAGLYYLQDPSAMSVVELLAPQPGERVLDLAAAPGGKATHLASLLNGGGLLVANEIKTKRVTHLMVNATRWGAGNIIITNETPERLADHFGPFFDRVLVDAPCSGEGMFRKDMRARADWSPEMAEGCATRQVNILRVAAKLVRAGGYLLYSTCTFAPEENEKVIFRFLNATREFESLPLPLFSGFMGGRPEWTDLAERRSAMRRDQAAIYDSLAGAVRLFPHRIEGDGHFACLLKRVGRIVPDEQSSLSLSGRPIYLTKRLKGFWQQFAEKFLNLEVEEARLRLVGDRLYLLPEDAPELSGLRVIHPGIWLGNFKKDRFEPAHPLALYLRKEQARNLLSLPAGSRELSAYLRGESLPSDGAPGWVLVCVEDFPLGWGKRVQGIVKNHYPRGWVVVS